MGLVLLSVSRRISNLFHFILFILDFLFTFQRVRMAGRRVAVKAIDWLAFAERVPPNQRSMFNGLKTRSDAIAAKLVKSFNFTD